MDHAAREAHTAELRRIEKEEEKAKRELIMWARIRIERKKRGEKQGDTLSYIDAAAVKVAALDDAWSAEYDRWRRLEREEEAEKAFAARALADFESEGGAPARCAA